MWEKVAGEYGTSVIWRDDRVEKTSEELAAERRADRIYYSEILKRFGWSDDDFSYAKSCGFPDPTGRTFAGKLAGQSCYSRSAIGVWLERFKAFAARLPKK